MSGTILPWISGYLLTVAETHGADLSSIPQASKGKKVQLTRFLTFGEENEYSIIWAKISDKDHIIPVRFSKLAIEEYHRSNPKPITQHKTAVISIKKFRPFFARIPLGGKGGMSDDCFLAIECDSLQYIGSSGESTFGDPKPIETHVDIYEWSAGLKRDGGAGNILRDRKKERETILIAPEIPSKLLNINMTTHSILPAVKHTPKVKSIAHPKTNPKTNLSKTYEKSWAVFRKECLRKPPDETAALLLTIPVYSDIAELKSHHPRTPQVTQLHNPLDFLTPLRSSINTRVLSSSPSVVISNWSDSPGCSPFSSPPYHSLPKSVNKIHKTPSHAIQPILAPQQHNKGGEGILPSSLPDTSQIIINETLLLTSSLPLSTSPSIHPRRSVTRKIPRPPQPILSRSSPSGPARILAPNSDTSLSYTQSQPQTHSQPQQDEYTTSQPFSQLSEPSKPHKEHVLTLESIHIDGDRNGERYEKAEDKKHSEAACDSLFSNEDGPLQLSPGKSTRGPSSRHGSSGAHPSPTVCITSSQQTGSSDNGNLMAPSESERANEIGQHPRGPLVDGGSQSEHKGLEEDDAQIQHELFGHGIQPRLQKSLTISPLSVSTKGITPAEIMKYNQDQGTIQHDVNAWSAPSFLRPSSTTNIDGKPATRTVPDSAITPDTLRVGETKVNNENIRNTPSDILTSEQSRGDQNRDPATRSPALLRSKKATQIHNPIKSGSLFITESQVQLSKRNREVGSDVDPIPQPVMQKKRKLNRNDATPVSIGKRDLAASGAMGIGERKKLHGFTVNLDTILLEDHPLPLVSWPVLMNILLRVGKDRAMENEPR